MIDRSSCIFCGPSGVKTLFTPEVLGEKTIVYRCSCCGLVFTKSSFEKDGDDPVENSYWASEEQKNIYLAKNIHDIFSREFEARLSAIENLYPSKGKLLDVGCGVGHFLKTAKGRGWSVYGLDISKAASEVAREAYSINVRIGTLENTSYDRAGFDVITLWDVIEHIRNPVENIQEANRLCKMGGVIAMKTPDENSLFKWAARTVYRLLGIRGSYLLKYVYYTPHYFSYTRKTMDLLLEKGGFEAVRYEKDITPLEFSKEKIGFHYQKDPKRAFVTALLPLALFLSRILGCGNKMIVYAKKVRDF